MSELAIIFDGKRYEFDPAADVFAPAQVAPGPQPEPEPAPEAFEGTWFDLTGYNFNNPRGGVNHVIPGILPAGLKRISLVGEDALIDNRTAGDNTSFIVDMAPGYYTLTVTDKNGATAEIGISNNAQRTVKFTFLRAGGYAVNCRF